jgi:hypothetical protein
MTKKNLLMTIFSAAVFCGSATLAQEPALNIDKRNHPNLAQAQSLVVQANNYIMAARKDNRYDLHGHALKAQHLLVEANEELKLAAEDLNAGR